MRAGRRYIWGYRPLVALFACLLGATTLFGAGTARASERDGSGVGVSPDGRHVYVNSPYGTYALARDGASGGLSLIDHYRQAGSMSIEITPDGGFVYAGGLSAPAHGYRRDSATGRLSQVVVTATHRTMLSGDIAVSPDGRQLYLSDTPAQGPVGEALRIFSRDPNSGALSERSILPLGSGGFAGMGLAMSADGRWLHAGRQLFERASDGGLSLVGDYTCDACFGDTLLLSPADDRLYAGPYGPAAYSRDPATGHVTPGVFSRGCCSGFNWQAPGGAMALAGGSVYAVDTHEGLVTQSRVTPEGLEYERTYRHPADAARGLEDARSIAVSPDGLHAYVAATADTSDTQGALVTTVATFRREPASGDLAFASLWIAPAPFTPPLPPGPKPTVAIEGGAAFTNDPRVGVRVSVPAGAAVELSSGPRFGTGTRRFERRAKGHYPWRLEARGPSRRKVVYARRVYRPGSGFAPSLAVKDQIVLDQHPPKLTAVRRTRRGNALLLRARDDRSRVRRVQVTPRRSRPGPKRRFRRRLAVRGAPKRLWVRVFDGAGNRSRWRGVRTAGGR